MFTQTVLNRTTTGHVNLTTEATDWPQTLVNQWFATAGTAAAAAAAAAATAAAAAAAAAAIRVMLPLSAISAVTDCCDDSRT